MVDDRRDAALCRAGADDANDPPPEVLGPDHKGPPAVPRAGRLLAVAVPSTELILAGKTGSGLLLALRPAQNRHRDGLQDAGVWGALLHPQPTPACDCALGPLLQEQTRFRQTNRSNVLSRLHLESNDEVYLNSLIRIH